MAYGFRDVDGFCVDCMTFEEAIEMALIYSDASGKRFRIEGEHIQHIRHHNVSRLHIYCWKVEPLEEYIGNQGIKGKARSNGRADRSFEGSENSN